MASENAIAYEPDHAEHFESLEQEHHAARFGMWVFLASEVLLFSALFGLYTAYRIHYPEGFREGVEHTARVLGSINTLVLICSSFTVALGLHALENRRAGTCRALLAVTWLLGLGFLANKALEYGKHFDEGIFPGGHTRFFVEHGTAGLPTFFNLYYAMTGAHAVHVIIGMTLLGWMFVRVGHRGVKTALGLELSALYWHLVDIVWIFLWPLFYLTKG